MAPYLLRPKCVADFTILLYGSLVQALYSTLEGSCHMGTKISLEAMASLWLPITVMLLFKLAQDPSHSNLFPSVPNGKLDGSSLSSVF